MSNALENGRRIPPRTRGRALLIAMLAAFACLSATADEMPEVADDLAIGVIVPDPDAADASPLAAAVARAAVQGARFSEEEHAFNAEMFGLDFSVPLRHASGAEAVTSAAQALLDEEGVRAVVGGFGTEDASALADWAADAGLPFLNVVASDDALRNEACRATTFHVAPSAAMYVDALVGWYVRSAYRDWFLVLGEGVDAEGLAERTRWSMSERHFGAREAGRAELARGGDVDALRQEIDRSGADLVFLLMDAEHQLEALAGLEDAGLEIPVAGFPDPEAQTRTFFDHSREAAPVLGSEHRATAWEASLDAYGARELNARFREAFDEPMEPSAWATYQAIKILFETATLGTSPEPTAMIDHLTDEQGVFDVWKGIGVTFRPWDRQLRQSLYLVKIRPDAEEAFAYADLVGELPAIYMPGTDPEERLDQLGDLRQRSRCST